VPLNPLKPGGSERPLFFVHGIGGETETLGRVAGHLPEGLPVFGIDVPVEGGTPRPSDSVPAMAAAYVEELKGVQPRGPYRLAGYSFGGSVAFEMACQLDRAGERVEPLIVIDHVPPPTRYEPFDPAPSNLVKVTCNLFRWVGTTLLDPLEEDATLAWAARRAYRQFRRAVVGKLRGPAKLDTDYVFSTAVSATILGVMEVHTRALRSFTPSPYRGPVTLIRASTLPLFRPYGRDLGWRRHAPRLRVRVVRGNHTSILKGLRAALVAREVFAAIREPASPHGPK
jgi:thioesterase domain-containing protein